MTKITVIPEIKREELKGFIAIEWGGASEEYSVSPYKIQYMFPYHLLHFFRLFSYLTINFES